jgi:predicted permease
MGMLSDVRYAVRGLRRSPGFLATAVLTLGLGIGATATMYSVVHDVLLAPLAYPEASRLVGIALTFPQEKPNAEETGASADFVMAHARSFESVGVKDDASTGANLAAGAGDARPVRVESTKISHGYFPTLGVNALMGRSFTAEEDMPGGPKVAMLSYGVWKRTFNGDAGVVNRVVRINEEPYTVVGVMPGGVFGSPEAEGGRGSVGLWLPLQMSAKDPGYDGTNYMMVGRLRSGVTIAEAGQEVAALAAPFFAANPVYVQWNKQRMHQFTVQPLQAVVVSEVKQSLLVLLAAVMAVLLVACLNLAGLMTARAATRQRELAVRTALGATRFGLLRLLVSESLVLAVGGSLLGLGLAQVARPLLLASSPMAIPMGAGASVWSVVAFVVVAAFVTALVCGLLPAWTVFRQDAQAAMKGGQAAGGTVSQVRLGKGLMVGQVAVAMVLLSAASLLLGSFLKIASTPTGMQVKRLMVAQVSLKGSGYEKTLATQQFVEKVVEGLQHQPGVQRVAGVNGLPLDRGLNEGGYPADRPDARDPIEFRTVTPNYFRTLGIPLLAGRDLTAMDRADAPHVVLVNEKAAATWWPGRSPIGQRLVAGGKSEGERTVVGVVADTRNHSLIAPDRVMIFAPMAQMSDASTKVLNGWFPTTFAIRMEGDVDVAAMVQKAVHDADPEMPVAKLTTMQEIVDHTVAAPKFLSWMAGGFAVFALLLTVIGLFGLLSYQVTQRTREIGVRMALGASREKVLGLILGRGVVLTTIGLAVGGVASLAVPGVVGSLLADNVAGSGGKGGALLSSSVIALGGAALAMLLAAGLASLLPARRAAGIEPVEALRAE